MRRATLGVLAVMAGAPALAQGPSASGDIGQLFCSGGVTASGGGVAVTADGDIFGLSRRGVAGALERRFVRRDPDLPDRLRALLPATPPASGPPGNMTCFLTWLAGPGRHRVQWPNMTPPPSLAPAVAALQQARWAVP